MKLSAEMKGWSYNQAKVRFILGMMSVAAWREYMQQWEDKNGEHESRKGVLPITRYIRRDVKK